jgi:uridylate kinase
VKQLLLHPNIDVNLASYKRTPLHVACYNGLYDKDPEKFSDARRFDTVSYDEVLAQHLGVMDASAIALARDNNLPIFVFSLDEQGGFKGILAGEGTYTKVHG